MSETAQPTSPVRDGNEIEERLAAIAPRLQELGVRRLDLFGSAARGELSAQSDVDLVVELAGPARLRPYMALKDLLERCLGRSVDLATTAALKPALRRRIQADLRRVA